MIETLSLVSQRPVIIALAMLGALLVVAGSLLPETRSGSQQALPQLLTRAGYTVTVVSMLLFITAGFLAERSP